MEDIKTLIFTVYEWLRIKINVYGFKISLWDMLVYSIILTIAIKAITSIFAHGGGD